MQCPEIAGYSIKNKECELIPEIKGDDLRLNYRLVSSAALAQEVLAIIHPLG
jgi:hypothetical protein